MRRNGRYLLRIYTLCCYLSYASPLLSLNLLTPSVVPAKQFPTRYCHSLRKVCRFFTYECSPYAETFFLSRDSLSYFFVSSSESFSFGRKLFETIFVISSRLSPSVSSARSLIRMSASDCAIAYRIQVFTSA